MNPQRPQFLRTAVMFWDSIRTIVPLSVKPYRTSKDLIVLESEKLLVPEIISDEDEIVQSIEAGALDYVLAPSASALLEGSATPIEYPEKVTYLNGDIEPKDFRPAASVLHRQKLSPSLREALRERGMLRPSGEWDLVEHGFANYYMTLLATKLATRRALVPVTDEPLSHDFSLHVALGDPGSTGSLGLSGGAAVNLGAAATLLARLSFDAVSVHPTVPMKDVVRFRDNHEGDVARFRSAVLELASSVVSAESTGDLEERCRSAFVNQVEPALQELRRRLRSARLRTATDSVQVAAFAGSSLAFAPLLGPWAPLAGQAVSLVLAWVRGGIDRQDVLAKSPFSYLLEAGRRL